MELVLREIYEPLFLHSSHGFRPKQSAHTALRHVDLNFRACSWIIEADLVKCFDRIPHNKLLGVLKKRVRCQKTLALIKLSLKAGHVEGGILSQNIPLGTPQGSALSPLLCNVFLHELDEFMEDLATTHNKGTRRRKKNSIYNRLRYKFFKAKERGDIRLMKDLRLQIRKTPSLDPMDPSFIRVAYTRYADDFLIGIYGPNTFAREIQEKVVRFIVEQLGMEVKKPMRVRSFSKSAKFLGALIKKRKVKDKPLKTMKAGPAKGSRVRISPRLEFHAPIVQLLQRLRDRGYLRMRKGKLKPTAMRVLVNHDHATILSQYNAVSRGILNYYRFADNRKSLGTLVHGLKMSCALTLALKYRLRTAAKVFKQYGSKLKCPETDKYFFIPETFARLNHFQKFATTKEKITPPTPPGETIRISYSNRLTKWGQGKRCVICGSTDVEMHHVRKLHELYQRRSLD